GPGEINRPGAEKRRDHLRIAVATGWGMMGGRRGSGATRTPGGGTAPPWPARGVTAHGPACFSPAADRAAPVFLGLLRQRAGGPRLPRRRPAARGRRGRLLPRLPQLQGRRAPRAAAGGQLLAHAGGAADAAPARAARLRPVVQRLPRPRPRFLAGGGVLPARRGVPARRGAV